MLIHVLRITGHIGVRLRDNIVFVHFSSTTKTIGVDVRRDGIPTVFLFMKFLFVQEFRFYQSWRELLEKS